MNINNNYMFLNSIKGILAYSVHFCLSFCQNITELTHRYTSTSEGFLPIWVMLAVFRNHQMKSKQSTQSGQSYASISM
jgi:hypothetical protein